MRLICVHIPLLNINLSLSNTTTSFEIYLIHTLNPQIYSHTCSSIICTLVPPYKFISLHTQVPPYKFISVHTLVPLYKFISILVLVPPYKLISSHTGSSIKIYIYSHIGSTFFRHFSRSHFSQHFLSKSRSKVYVKQDFKN
jgi:hypothetical protein